MSKRRTPSAFPPVLDACCGGRHFWFDKKDGRALFVDKRQETIVWGGKQRPGRCDTVIAPDQLADFTALPFLDEFRVGKMNHMPADEASIDWSIFALTAAALVRDAGKKLYIKDDLRKLCPTSWFTSGESDCDRWNVPDRLWRERDERKERT